MPDCGSFALSIAVQIPTYTWEGRIFFLDEAQLRHFAKLKFRLNNKEFILHVIFIMHFLADDLHASIM